ncbi:ribose-5-phosphate isomerase RpiA [Ammoniphilus resinae]|uniref:Ribose-5-phosphate isomerase A n=1 Tax=Ammoniphilus resinae TaxID=861532 RepID=A0ABS4GTG6_9BACL|nr:ribose-5-phosphate isomerase RpiA [Ammoniphilus resinae]MBP1933574.1 ribose 5-phosphate isomerase A [Ammoniphilus resinae]
MKPEELSKKLAGEKAVDYIEQDMLIGLGTGSTVFWTMQKLAERVKEGLRIQAVPTSTATEELARKLGIPLLTLEDVKELDLVIDGADEISAELDLIKGGGGALLREKLVALASKKRIIVADSGKLTEELGGFPLPIEIVRFGWEQTFSRVLQLGCQITLREAENTPFITDNGNYILDCKFDGITDPVGVHQQLKLLPGVIETGLFVQLADVVVVGFPDRFELLER